MDTDECSSGTMVVVVPTLFSGKNNRKKRQYWVYLYNYMNFEHGPYVVSSEPSHHPNFNHASGNKVCRRTILCGSQNIVLQGKVIIQSEAIIRGDLANVKTGRYCIISKQAVIRPPYKKFSKGVAFFPLTMGDHVFIGEKSVVSAAVIGNFVYIGKNCVIGRRCELKDGCVIEDDTILAPETVVPPFTRYGGSPGVQVGTLPEVQPDVMVDYTRSYYQHFITSRNPI